MPVQSCLTYQKLPENGAIPLEGRYPPQSISDAQRCSNLSYTLLCSVQDEEVGKLTVIINQDVSVATSITENQIMKKDQGSG